MEQEMVKLILNGEMNLRGTNPRPIAERIRIDETDNWGSYSSIRVV